MFDYIHAGIPVLASPLVEIKRIVEGYDIGSLITDHDPRNIAIKINDVLDDKIQLEIWRENLKFAAKELCWEKEEKTIQEVYNKFV